MNDTPDAAAALHDLLPRQRACRAYLPDPIDDDRILALLEAATRAPSAENTQPWQFVVVSDADRLGEIWDLARKAYEYPNLVRTRGTLPPALHDEVDQGITSGFGAAPVSIVVGADTDRCSANLVGSSIFPAVQNLLLAATAHGLGSALTTISTVFAGKLAAVVGFPDSVLPVAVVPLGHPAKPLGLSRREPVADHVHRDVYGQRF